MTPLGWNQQQHDTHITSPSRRSRRRYERMRGRLLCSRRFVADVAGAAFPRGGDAMLASLANPGVHDLRSDAMKLRRKRLRVRPDTFTASSSVAFSSSVHWIEIQVEFFSLGHVSHPTLRRCPDVHMSADEAGGPASRSTSLRCRSVRSAPQRRHRRPRGRDDVLLRAQPFCTHSHPVPGRPIW